jgi:hypothetical protein
MDDIEALARRATCGTGGECSTTSSSCSDDAGSDNDSDVALALLRHERAPGGAAMLQPAADGDQDSDFSASVDVAVHHVAAMKVMAALFRTRTDAGDGLHAAIRFVYDNSPPSSVRAHKRLTDDVKHAFDALQTRTTPAVGGSSGTTCARVLTFISTMSTCSSSPRWRAVEAPSTCALSGEPADVQFQLDVDAYKAYAQWLKSERAHEARAAAPLPADTVTFNSWLTLPEYQHARPPFFEFCAQRSKIPYVLALLQLTGFVSFASEFYLSHDAAALLCNYSTLKELIGLMC